MNQTDHSKILLATLLLMTALGLGGCRYEPATAQAATTKGQSARLDLPAAAVKKRLVLEVVEIRPLATDFSRRRAEVLLVFGDPVDAESLEEGLALECNGKPVKPAAVKTLEREVTVLVDLPEVNQDNKLKVTLFGQVKSKDGKLKLYRPVEKTVDLGRPAELKIYGVEAREGSKGYHLFVNCRDQSDDSGHRCNLEPEVLKATVRVDPPLKLTFVPQNYGLRVLGDFKEGEYALTIDQGLTTSKGGVLLHGYSRKVKIGRRTPLAKFVTKGRYLPRQRLTSVPVRHLNLAEIEVKVRQIPEQNLVFWLSGQSESAGARDSELVAGRRFGLKDVKDEERSSWLDLASLVPPEGKGVFEFALWKDGTKHDSVRLSLTGISLVVKRSGPKNGRLMVWALDAENLNPRKGVTVKIFTRGNRLLAEARTDGEGLARFNLDGSNRLEEQPPFAVIAKLGTDLTAMRFEDLEVPLSEHQVEGRPFQLTEPYRASLYTGRGVYRPGETAHLTALIWEDSNQAPSPPLPLIGRLKDPRGKEVKRISAKTNSSGMAGFDLDFLDFANTGRYEFTLEVAGKALAAHSLHVEEFAPERMTVKVAAVAHDLSFADPASFQVEAAYLFGAVPRGEKVEVECALEPAQLQFDAHPGYGFGVYRPERAAPVALKAGESRLDDSGRALISCPAVKDVVSFQGPGKVSATARVMEAGSGRTTVAVAGALVHPGPWYVGLSSAQATAEPGRLVEVLGVVVDWRGELITDIAGVKIELQEMESEWGYEYDPAYGGSQWKRSVRFLPAKEETVAVKDGRFKYAFHPAGDWPEGHLVSARLDESTRTDLLLRGSGWWWGDYEEYGSDERTPPAPRPAGLVIEVPPSVEAGQAAKMSAVLPYPGRLLLTVETDRVVSHRWHEVKAGAFSADFVAPADAPNLYVSALLVKDPASESKMAFIPGRSFGVKSVKVRPRRHELTLSMTTPKEIEPNHELIVELDVGKTQGPVFATVAAVDEGILQLTRHRSPDPLAEMFAQRRLGVSTFETVGWTLLLPPAGDPQSPGGGDGEEADPGAGGGQGRVQPIKPVALWSGLVELGPDGKAVVKLPVPTYRGQLRVMAVAAGAQSIGTAAARVYVRDPLVLQPTFPRFLTANDEFVVPVSVTNLTGAKQTVEVALRAGPTVISNGQFIKSAVLEPGRSGVVTFVMRAGDLAQGRADFEVEASAGPYLSRDRASIPIQPAQPMTQDLYVKRLEPGKNDLSPYLQDWLPQYDLTTVTVTSNRYVHELGHLKYLVRYPYGCIEQTTSTTRPLLFIGNLLPAIDPQLTTDGTIAEKFMYGVDRILGMQTSSGGFSYWPGADMVRHWHTAYATHLLLEGLDAGYPIDRDRVNNALDFMEKTLNRIPDRPDNHSEIIVAEPYMHYVLARAGRGRTKRMNDLIKAPSSEWGALSEENLFLLKAGLHLAGDRAYANELRELKPLAQIERRNDWTYWSSLRTRGLMLNILEDLFPQSGENESLAMLIADNLDRQSHHYTTQELSWAVSGLGKHAAPGAVDWSTPVLTMNGKTFDSLPVTDPKDKTAAWQLTGAGGTKSLLLNLDRISGGALYAMVRVEGVKPGSTVGAGDYSIRARRSYRNAAGSLIGLGQVKLGEIVFIELTLENLSSDYINNVALVDRFAAGFEIENPRLGRERAADWMDRDRIWSADHMNLRDDRIEIFGGINPRAEVRVYYVVRAVTAGRFSTPPLRAEAMYDPDVHSQSAGPEVVIHDPWNVITD